MTVIERLTFARTIPDPQTRAGYLRVIAAITLLIFNRK